MPANDPRMAGLAPESVAELQAAARAIRDGRSDEAERLLAALRGRFPAHPEALRVHAILRHGRQPLEVSRRCVAQVRETVRHL